MAMITNDQINAIRSKANIVDIIGSYIPLTQRGRNYLCVCPFHDDHSPSMSVSEEKQIYKCFSCGNTGNVFTFVENYENVSFLESVAICFVTPSLKLTPQNISIHLCTSGIIPTAVMTFEYPFDWHFITEYPFSLL